MYVEWQARAQVVLVLLLGLQTSQLQPLPPVTWYL
jgi:hypothetical protein